MSMLTRWQQRFVTSLVTLCILLMGLPFAHAQQDVVNYGDKFFGNLHPIAPDDVFYKYWNQTTPENAGKWGSVEAARDQMSWGALDIIFRDAAERGFPVKQHTFVWGQQEPRWLASLTPEEQYEEVLEWMAAFAERYPDVPMIDVVNEPLHAPPSYVEAIGGSGDTGWDWVIWSFEQARIYFPEAELFLNEYNILCCADERARYAEIIQLLQERDLIDGIGLQAHGLNEVDPSVIQANLDAMAELGLPIHISEFDINTWDDDKQRDLYASLFPIFWEHPAVTGVTLWGYRAGETWLSDSYLIDWFDEERPALAWVREYLEENTPQP